MVLEERLPEAVDVDKMQYGFMPGGGTFDAVLVLSYFLYLLTWKRLLIGCQGNLFVFLCGGWMSQDIW